jgi:outer membrane protein
MWDCKRIACVALRGLATAVTFIVAAAGIASQRAMADSLEGALAAAYQNNPQLNSQRAATRATDENVGIALSSYRPKVTANAQIGEQYLDTLSAGMAGRAVGTFATGSYGATASQTLFNGFQTSNRTRQAEHQVSAAREALRNTEQAVLLGGATAYMNLLRDGALLELQRSNVNVLEATLRQMRDRLKAGEITRTDLAQTESSLAAARSSLHAAQSNYVTSKSAYVQVIGTDPGKLARATPVDRLSPPNLTGALDRGASRNPLITNAMYNVDAAMDQIKIAESALSPALSLNGSIQKSYGSPSSLATLETLSGAVAVQLSVPLYQGGAEFATIRQAKETLGQRRLDLDTARLSVQQNITQSWGQIQAAKAQIDATSAQVTAAEIALDGVRQEAQVGQRTTLDVLNAQQALVQARTSMVIAQHDRIVASYALLAAVGSLSPQVLGLAVAVYDPGVHYQQVRDSWFGVRTPDGR